MMYEILGCRTFEDYDNDIEEKNKNTALIKYCKQEPAASTSVTLLGLTYRLIIHSIADSNTEKSPDWALQTPVLGSAGCYSQRCPPKPEALLAFPVNKILASLHLTILPFTYN